MKRIYYGAILCLSACSTAPTASKEQEAVSAYIKANTNDSASYEAVRWAAPLPFSRRDSLKAVVQPILDDIAEFNRQRNFVDKVLASPGITDTARVGTLLVHTYRAKNKMGALVLDSAQFVVYKDGKVAVF